jgi:anthraniloyl-CoA monooxygenase
MLELHCAHGYLLASFISPLTNHRDDEYGGGVEGRARFPLEVFSAVRAAWPAERPMSVRLSCTDWEEGGLSGEDFLATARLFMEAGCDLLNTSTGQTTSTGRPAFGRLFQAPYSERARLELGAATMVAGGVSSYGDVNSLLIAGRADLCLIGRAHLFDPYWTRHAAYEQGYPLAWPQPYGVVGGRYRPRMEWSGGGDVKD